MIGAAKRRPLANVHESLGQYQQALDSLNLALRLVREDKDKEDEAAITTVIKEIEQEMKKGKKPPQH